MRLFKVLLIIETPQPKSKIFCIHIKEGPIHIVIKTPEILNLPKLLRIRNQILGLSELELGISLIFKPFLIF